MAVVLDREKDKDTATGPMATGGGATQDPGQISADPSQPQGSGRFTDLRKYMTANEGAGERLTGQLGATGQRASERVGRDITARGDQSTDRAADIREGIEQGRGVATQAFQTPGQLNEEQQGQFQQAASGGLSQQAQDFDTDISGIQTQAQSLQDQADLTKGGRFGLLQETFGAPGQQYTSGQRSLDQLFLQATPEAGQLAQDLQQQATAAQERATGLGETIGAEQEALLGETGATQADIAELLRTGMFNEEDLGLGFQDIASELATRADDRSTDVGTRQSELERIMALATEGKALGSVQLADGSVMSGEDFLSQQTGVNLDEALYGTQIGDFMNVINPDLAAGQVSTQEEQDRYEALTSLFGGPVDNEIAFQDTVDPQQLFNVNDIQQRTQENKQAFEQQVGDEVRRYNNSNNMIAGARDIFVENTSIWASVRDKIDDIIDQTGGLSEQDRSVLNSALSEFHNDQSGRTKSNIIIGAFQKVKDAQRSRIEDMAQEGGAMRGFGGREVSNFNDLLAGLQGTTQSTDPGAVGFTPAGGIGKGDASRSGLIRSKE